MSWPLRCQVRCRAMRKSAVLDEMAATEDGEEVEPRACRVCTPRRSSERPDGTRRSRSAPATRPGRAGQPEGGQQRRDLASLTGKTLQDRQCRGHPWTRRVSAGSRDLSCREVTTCRADANGGRGAARGGSARHLRSGSEATLRAGADRGPRRGLRWRVWLTLRQAARSCRCRRPGVWPITRGEGHRRDVLEAASASGQTCRSWRDAAGRSDALSRLPSD